MPSLIAHSLCGEKALLQCDAGQLRKIINRHKRVFIYGCQGPDFLFFYRALPLFDQKKASQVQTLGTMLHFQKIDEAFRFLLQRIRENPDEESVSFLAGWLCHHALDARVHPYVYWRTHSLAGKVGYQHQQLESQMERGILDHFGLKTEEYVVWKMMKYHRGEMERPAQLVSDLINEVYGKDLSREVCLQAMRDFMTMARTLHDVSGRRFRTISALEKLAGHPGRATALMVPLKYDDTLDALNLRRDTWRHPVTGESCDAGVMQMFDQAGEESRQRFVLLESWLQCGEGIEELLQLIGNRGYDTGTAVGTMTFFAHDQNQRENV